MSQIIDMNTPARPVVKVGIIPCNGEEICEGTLTRHACRKVLDELRPGQTVTICLPLFIAGDQAEKEFATKFPTITLDGCDKRCSAISTEQYSAKPTRSLVVTDILAKHNMRLTGNRDQLSDADQEAIRVISEDIAQQVDEIVRSKEA